MLAMQGASPTKNRYKYYAANPTWAHKQLLKWEQSDNPAPATHNLLAVITENSLPSFILENDTYASYVQPTTEEEVINCLKGGYKTSPFLLLDTFDDKGKTKVLTAKKVFGTHDYPILQYNLNGFNTLQLAKDHHQSDESSTKAYKKRDISTTASATLTAAAAAPS
jgi:hypothetical protein